MLINLLRQCKITFLLLLLPAMEAQASETLATTVDLVWVALCAALVFFMQAGFALLEGGSSRAKNSLNVIMKNYSDLCVGLLAYWAIGFGLMFGANSTGWFGTDHFFFSPKQGRDAVFLLYQAMFAATAATIVSGAVAERMRFWPYMVGSVFITAFIYPVFGSWAWGSFFDGSGWLAEAGFIDFAGSTVVHSVGGWSALAAIIVLGPRLGRFGRDGTVRDIPGHNLPLVSLGVFVIWFGWFGFNGGSTLVASEAIGSVLLNTQLAGAAGALGALWLMAMSRGPVLMTTMLYGGLGGLVAITAGCATMSTPFAVVTGFVGGLVSVAGSQLLKRFKLDDVVDAVSVHGFCGAWGTLAAGLFFTGDLFEGQRVLTQLLGISVAFVWTFPTAFAVFWVTKRTLGLRVNSIDEQRGLDFSEHFEIGYPEFQADLTNRKHTSGKAQGSEGYTHVVTAQ